MSRAQPWTTKRILFAPIAVLLYAFIYVPFAWALLGQSFATRKPVRPEEVRSTPRGSAARYIATQHDTLQCRHVATQHPSLQRVDTELQCVKPRTAAQHVAACCTGYCNMLQRGAPICALQRSTGCVTPCSGRRASAG
jgi:hypothetical protein